MILLSTSVGLEMQILQKVVRKSNLFCIFEGGKRKKRKGERKNWWEVGGI